MNTNKLLVLKKKINHRSDVPENYTGIAESSSGVKYWYLNGMWHREDGPAIEYPEGGKSWYLYDKNYLFNDFFEATTDEGRLAIIWRMNEYK